LDREEIYEQRNEKLAKFMKYFGLVMAVFYVMLGLLFIYFPIIEGITNTIKYFLSTMLIVYGAFRFYRAIK